MRSLPAAVVLFLALGLSSWAEEKEPGNPVDVLAPAKPIYTQGLDWMGRPWIYEQLEKDKYTIDYEISAKRQNVPIPTTAFLAEADEAQKILWKALDDIDRSRQKELDHFAAENVLIRIQETAAMCRLLGKPLVKTDRVRIQVFTQVAVHRLHGPAGSAPFLIEVTVSEKGKELRGYFYQYEFMNLYPGEGEWRDKKIVFTDITQEEE